MFLSFFILFYKATNASRIIFLNTVHNVSIKKKYNYFNSKNLTNAFIVIAVLIVVIILCLHLIRVNQNNKTIERQRLSRQKMLESILNMQKPTTSFNRSRSSSTQTNLNEFLNA